MLNDLGLQQAITEASSVIAAQLEDLRSEVYKQRCALETIAEYMPSLIEAVRNLYEIVGAIDRLAEKNELSS
mgnify:FL=1